MLIKQTNNHFLSISKKFEFPTEVKAMILAILENKTICDWKYSHYCKEHLKMVDKNHIDDCTLIK